MSPQPTPPRRRLRPRTAIALGTVLCASCAGLIAAAPALSDPPRPATNRADADGFVPLVTETFASDFDLVGIEKSTLTIKGGEVAVSGHPDGYFATRKSYKNYTLRFEWKYDRPAGLKDDAKFSGNSGLLIHIVGQHKIWPKCIEMQLMNADAGHVFGVGAKFASAKVPGAQQRAIKPVGAWNATEVVCKDGAIAASLNGVVISSGRGDDVVEGKIAWQSEGAPIRFRKLEIKEAKP